MIRNSLLETISAVIGTDINARKFAGIFLEQIHQLELSDISINSYEFKKQKANEMNEMRYMIYLKLSPEEKIENNIAKMTHEQIIDFLDEKIKEQL